MVTKPYSVDACRTLRRYRAAGYVTLKDDGVLVTLRRGSTVVVVDRLGAL